MNAKPLAPEMDRPASTQPLWLAVGIAVVWILILFWLTWKYSNPVTLNISQFRHADVVVIGKVTTDDQGRRIVIPVDEAKWPLASKNAITVTNLDQTGARTGQSYLLPLKRGDAEDKFAVQEAELVEGLPLIYPANEESEKQLFKILAMRPLQVVP